MKSKLLGNVKKGLLFILSAPAGTGKTTIVERLTNEFACVVKNTSYTTRKPRSGEVPGTHYHFINKEQFDQKVAANDFLEYVKLYDDYYGTSRQWVEQQLESGHHVFLIIDTQGAKQLREKVDATFIFLKPPSFEELERRLRARNTEPEAMLETRLKWAKKELDEEKFYDYQIVNDNIDIAYHVLKSIVIAEEHRIRLN